MAEYLSVVDSRTGSKYQIPINNNAIKATEFAKIDVAANAGTHSFGNGGGLKIFDPGFRNTAVTTTKITYLDTQRGTLNYRGKNIDELFRLHEYEDVAFLLIYGHLPNRTERQTFRTAITSNLEPSKYVRDVVEAFEPSAPSFTIVLAALAAWNGARPDLIPTHNGRNIWMSPKAKDVEQGIARTIAAVSTVIALVACHKRNVPFQSPDPTQSLPWNILYMSNLVGLGGKPDPEYVRILSKVMLLYADNDMTNSTAAFMHVASALADPITCTMAGLSSGTGPLHGGALEMAWRQFESIGQPERVPAFMDRVRAKEMRIFGFGHRVWKTTDPRDPHMRELMASSTLRDSIRRQPILSIAMEVDRMAMKDEYCIRNHLSPNVDLLATFVFSALGFPHDMSLPVAFVARTAGFMAHWREQLHLPIAIWRPQSVFVGSRASASEQSEQAAKRTPQVKVPQVEIQARL